MPYDDALSKAWGELTTLTQEKNYTLSFLADNYEIDIKNRHILSSSCNAAIKDFLIILILHYLKQHLKGLPALENEWIDFQELAGGRGYYPVFKKRVIERILRKYGPSPEGLLEALERFGAKRTQLADISIALETFAAVPVLITLWRGDAEFGPEANIHFDRNISRIFCTEDIVVLSEFVAGQL